VEPDLVVAAHRRQACQADRAALWQGKRLAGRRTPGRRALAARAAVSGSGASCLARHECLGSKGFARTVASVGRLSD
jgi:hypothetical protein